eukprot:scaffold4291_cov75-Cylindrotheca_fusiformis.AAC.3
MPLSRSIPCEKESCLWKLQRTRILEKDICAVCRELTLQNKTTKGVCYLLYPEKEPEEEKQKRREAAAYENKENGEGSKRKRLAPTQFEACPAGGPHQMQANRPDTHRKRTRLRNTLEKKAKANETSLLRTLNGIGDCPIGSRLRDGISAGAKSKHTKGLETAILGVLDLYFKEFAKSEEEEEFCASVRREVLESLLMRGVGRNKSIPKGESGGSMLSSKEEEGE